MSTTEEQIRRRRTFAIISHPDAGKTTLTEKFLLYGGAIQAAGMVKGKKNMKHAVSDWMEIEKQRGISVTSSVMQFEYDGYCINILDTPGHQDFSEDTYRTLMAADTAVMVIDASKGVEAQTKKLFKVCVMRHIPIFTFINKMDREARDPLDVLEEIENVLGIQTYPVNWPIGSGKIFRGVYDRTKEQIAVFSGENGKQEAHADYAALHDAKAKNLMDPDQYEKLLEDMELLEGAGSEFSQEAVDHGELSPVFFGSALTNFGVEPFLRDFLNMTSPPLPRQADCGTIDPFDKDFSGFIFKIQANMNKAHRDRIAFMRICSGRFDKDAEVYHVQGDKRMRLAQPQTLMAQDRETVQEAFAGDIIGIFDPGIFSIGDTICAPNKKFHFEGIPSFEPEHFRLVRQIDTMKRKQFVKGMTQIAQEGAIQIFSEPDSGMEEVIVGVVGVLQFDVLEHRLKNEYNVDVKMEPLTFQFARWVGNKEMDLKTLDLTSDTKLAQDLRGNPILLFSSEWNIRWAEEHNKDLILENFNRN
ncbi:MAG: peptide chain release factor 3 [Clostridia bacterium]|nr:peptide chain release factor 3 [Clostridia bacterium]